MSNIYSQGLTVGVIGSIGAAAVSLFAGEMTWALAAFIALALFAYAFNWVPVDE